MIVEKTCGNYQGGDKRVDYVTLEWFEREKKRMRKTTSAGEEIGIAVSTYLQEGDILAEEQKR